MELRHLRYFVAVAEEGSLTVAAERRLFTAQPSLSRQIRALEEEVGVPLLERSARGMTLTPAGKVYLDHVRMALAQVEAAGFAARAAAVPSKPHFALGFLTGQEMNWLPRAMAMLGDELHKVDVTVSSQYSPQLADGLLRKRLDAAFMRREPDQPELEYRLVEREPLLVVLPSDHRLAAREAIDPRELADEVFIAVSNTAPVLRAIIDDYLQQCGVEIVTEHKIDNLAMAISLVASTRGVSLLPKYAQNFLPWSVISRPLIGEPPAIDLVVGYRKADSSALLASFLERLDTLQPA